LWLQRFSQDLASASSPEAAAQTCFNEERMPRTWRLSKNSIKVDIEFTRSQNYKRLMDIWSKDAVRFMPGSPPDVGK
jgi:hypothetical protein